MDNFIYRANLSNDYFSNRQDRYFMIEDCKDLCDFYCNLVERVTEFSFQLEPNGNTSFSSKISSHPFESPNEEFAREASSKIRRLFQTEMNKRSELNKTGISITIQLQNHFKIHLFKKKIYFFRNFENRHVGISVGTDGPTQHQARQ